MTLIVEGISQELKDALCKKAEEEHRTVDEVAVEALQAGLGVVGGEVDPTDNQNFAKAIQSHFVEFGGVELELPAREPMREPPEFNP